MLCIELDDPMTVLTQAGDDPPLVEYSSMLSNPFEKKRVLKSLGYMPMDGFTDGQLGTIHILRKHLYSAKLNLITKLGFFVKTKEFIFQRYYLKKI